MSAEIHVYLSLLLTWHYIFLLEKLMVSLGFYVQCLRLQYGTMNIINQENMRENDTVVENYRKSTICERSELHLHFEWTKDH